MRHARQSNSAPPSEAVAKLGAGRRVAPRVPMSVDCAVLWDGAEVDGLLLDLSIGGAAIELTAELPLPVGAQVSLVLSNPAGDFAVPASIVSQAQETFAAIVARVSFIEPSVEVQALVDECAAAFRDRQASVFRDHLLAPGSPRP